MRHAQSATKKSRQNNTLGGGDHKNRKIFISRGLPSFANRQPPKEPITPKCLEAKTLKSFKLDKLSLLLAFLA